MEGVIDFDPLTAEGREDINDTVDNEYESLLQQEDETPSGWYERIRARFGSRTKFAISHIRNLFKTRNPRSSVPVYLQMREDYQTDYTTPQYEMISEIARGLKEKRPNVDLARLEFKVNAKGRGMVKYVTGKKWYYLYHSKTGDLLKSMPKNIKDAIGEPTLREQKESLEEREEIEMKEFKSAIDDAVFEAAAEESNVPSLKSTGSFINQVKTDIQKNMQNLEDIDSEPSQKDAFEARTKLLLNSFEEFGNMIYKYSRLPGRKEGVLKTMEGKIKNLCEKIQKSRGVREGPEPTEAVIEDMSNLYEGMQEEIDRLKEKLADSRNFNINRLTQPEWGDRVRELEEALENNDAEVETLKESMVEAEAFYVMQNEAVTRAQKHESFVTQERINTLIEDRNDAHKDYFKLKGEIRYYEKKN